MAPSASAQPAPSAGEPSAPFWLAASELFFIVLLKQQHLPLMLTLMCG